MLTPVPVLIKKAFLSILKKKKKSGERKLSCLGEFNAGRLHVVIFSDHA